MELSQDFSSVFNSNSPGAGQTPTAAPATPAPNTAPNGLTQDFSSVFAPQQQQAAPQTSRPVDAAALNNILTQENATSLHPLVSAFMGQESGGGANAKTSVDGAHGAMQITPATFMQYAKPGEQLDDPNANIAVGTRILSDLAKRYNGDPAKIAVAYFSGPGNVATSGPTPWKQDKTDGNGMSVSGYVQGILGRLGNQPTAAPAAAPQAPQPQQPAGPDLSQAPKWSDVVANPVFQKLDPAAQQQTADAYFTKWIAPSVPADQFPAAQAEWAQKSAAVVKQATPPSLLSSIGSGINSAASALTNSGFATDGVTPDNPAAQNAAVAQAPQQPNTAGVLGVNNTPAAVAAAQSNLPPLPAMASPAMQQQVFQQFDAGTPAQRQQLMQQPGVAGQLAQYRAAQYQNNTNPASSDIGTSVEDRAQRLVNAGVLPSVAQAQAQRDAASGAPTMIPGDMKASNFDFDTAAKYSNANPFMRGAVQGVAGSAQSLVGIGRFVNDMTGGNGDVAGWLDNASKNVSSTSAAIGQSANPLTRNLEAATSGVVQIVPAMLGAAVTDGASALPIAQFGMQTFGQSYDEGRSAGQTPAQATLRSGMLAAVSMLGHAAGIGPQLEAIQKSIAGAATDDIAGSAFNSFMRDLPSTQAMALGNFITDKLPGGVGLSPDAKFSDWLNQAGNMFVQTAMMNGMLGGASLGGAPLARTLRGEVTPTFDETSNTISDKNGQYWNVQPGGPATPNLGAPGTSANAPHPSQVAADSVVREMAAAHGLDASGLVPDATPVPQSAPMPPTAIDPQGVAAQPGQPMVWRNADTDVPVVFHGVAPTPGADGRAYAQVDHNGQMSFVPLDQLRPASAVQAPSVSPSDTSSAAPAPQSSPAETAAATQAPAIDPQQVIEFAQQRYDALLAKQRGTLEPTMAPTGHDDVEVAGQSLTPTERMEWDALRQYRDNPAALAHFYGFDGATVDTTAPTAAEVNTAAHEAATSPQNSKTEPTEGQKQAGNYELGHVEDIHGLNVSIENPQGSTRSGTDADGVVWSNTLQDHYGYIRGTTGADGDHVDTFIGPNPQSTKAFIVDQRDPATGKFDEHKVMLGYDSMADADAAYHRNYETGWTGRGAISELPIGMFKEWLANGDTRAPYAREATPSMRSAGSVAPPKTEREAQARKLELADGTPEAQGRENTSEAQEGSAAPRPVAGTDGAARDAATGTGPDGGTGRGSAGDTAGAGGRVQPESDRSGDVTEAARAAVLDMAQRAMTERDKRQHRALADDITQAAAGDSAALDRVAKAADAIRYDGIKAKLNAAVKRLRPVEPVEELTAVSTRNDHGLAGENAPGAKESLERTLREFPDIGKPSKHGISYEPPAWNELPNGFAFRQYVVGGRAFQEVRAPKRGDGVEPPVLRRILEEDGKVSGEREATGTLGDVLSGKSFEEFDNYFEGQTPTAEAAKLPAPTKPKTEIEARKARVERMVGKVGDIVRASTDFDYVKASKPMRIERIEKSGAVRFVDPDSGSGTTVTHGMMDSALRKVTFEKVEQPKAETLDERRARVTAEMDKITAAAEARKQSGDAEGLPVPSGYDHGFRESVLDWMTEVERDRFHALKLELPSPGEEREEAAARVAAKVAARKAEPKPLDHGELNMPLAKRGDIDAQIDRYKADQTKVKKTEAKARSAEFKADKARAKELYAEVGQDLIDQHGAKYDPKELRATLDSMVKWEPKKFIALAEKFQSERSEQTEESSTEVRDTNRNVEPQPKARTEAQIAAAKKRAREQNTVDPARDSLITAIAKLGGINKAEVIRQWGYGANDLKGYRVGIKPVTTKNGLTIERMGEALHELGYLQSDEHGRYDNRELEEHFSNGLGGSHHFTPEGYATHAAAEAQTEYELHHQGLTEHDVEASGFDRLPEEAQQHVEAYLDQYPEISEAEAEHFGTLASVDGAHAELEPHADAADAGHRSDGEAREGARSEEDPFSLTAESADETRARLAREEAQRTEVERTGKEADKKAKIDAQRDDFVLTGSDREADQAAARGQNPLFDLQDASGFARTSALSAKPEPDRTSALATLRRLSKRLDAGEITDSEFRLGAQNLLAKLEDKRDGQLDRKADRTRVRGDLYVRERLLRAERQGDISHEGSQFAQWLLDQNPAIADDLGIGVRGAKDGEGGTAGMYNSINRVVTLISGNTNDGTAVHEILHHTERMMPADIRHAIYKAWSRDWQQAYKDATPEQKPFFAAMLKAAVGSQSAWAEVAKGFRDGILKYDDHYKLVNPSEYWAVKATDLMKSRYDAKGWIARAKQWLKELVEKVKGIFGLSSDAPVIHGMESVLKGEGTFTTDRMMAEKAPAHPDTTADEVALHAVFHDLTKTPTERADDSYERAKIIIDKSFDTKSTARTWNAVSRTFESQVSKALKSPEYMRVFDAMRRMMNHTGLAATRPAELAPRVVPNSNNLRQSVKTLFSGPRQIAEMQGATRALLDGTLAGENVHDGRTWSDQELRSIYGLSDKGVEVYKQTRAAIDASLDEVAAAEAWSMVNGFAPMDIRDQIVNNPAKATGLIRGSLDKKIEMLQKAHDRFVKAGDAQKAEILHSLMMPYVETRKKVDDIFDKAETLKSAGYVPLMRFGKYTVYAHKIDPETGLSARDEVTDQPLVHYFGMFPTEAEAKAEHERQVALYKDDPTVHISRGVKSEKSHQLYDGLSPETLSLFADKVGADDAMKQVIQLALSERSALKRRLGRRAITGYSDDMPRILSNFLTSNGRFASQRLFMRDVNRAIQEIPKEKGDVMDEAIKLKQFVLNGEDPGSRTMASMFLWTMAGAPVSAAVVATEPFQKVFPYLAQFGVGRATASLGKAIAAVVGRMEIKDPEMRAALQRADREGIIHPQQIFHLYDQGMANMGTWLSSQLAAHSGPGAAVTKGAADQIRARARAMTTMLGMMHSAAESFGRNVAFHAAWHVAKARNEKDPYTWTVRAIDEAGSQFGKINRSNFERSYAGRMMMAYKNFTFGWLGLLFRMARKGGVEGARGVAVMLAMQMAMGGLTGLPFMTNLDDLVDTIGNFMGHNTDFARIKRQWSEHTFGKVAGDLFMHGFARHLPVDLSEHFGMGDIIPGTDLLKAENAKDKARNVLNVLGPQMQLITRAMDAYDAAAAGNLGKAGLSMAPNFIKRPMQGLSMMASGQSTDMGGHKIADASTGDAISKIMGGASAHTNEQTELRNEISQANATMQDKQAQITNEWARGVVQGDSDAVQKAKDTLQQWNDNNPDSRIVVTAQAISAQVKSMREDANLRAIMTAPKGLKADAVSTLRENRSE